MSKDIIAWIAGMALAVVGAVLIFANGPLPLAIGICLAIFGNGLVDIAAEQIRKSLHDTNPNS